MNTLSHMSLLAAAARYQRAVRAVFLKWNADEHTTPFTVFDLGCACCEEHRELREAWAALNHFTQEPEFDP